MQGRLIAVGDIHGCYKALAALLEAIAPTPRDTIVTLGDYVDRGDDTRRALDRLIALAEECTLVPILGNHDEMMLEARTDRNAKRRWLDCGGVEAMMSYGPELDLGVVPGEHWTFLESCREFFETDSHFFVHANYDASLPLDRQDRLTLRWLDLQDSRPLPHFSSKISIVGHSCQASHEILDLGFLKCLDTGCWLGGWLTAMEIRSGQLWQTSRNGEVRQLESRSPQNLPPEGLTAERGSKGSRLAANQ